jgi:ribosomal-protein-alanine N-acetyltransferase
MPDSGLKETLDRPPADPGSLSIRELAYADLSAVVSIERRSFGSPWSPGMFVLEMSKESTIGLVAETAGRIIGYIVLSRYDRAWHLMNVAVDPAFRRAGTASRLIDAAFSRSGGPGPVTLEVRPTNVAAIALYERHGFRAYGHRRGYYPDNGEDALVMWRGDPSEAGVPPEALERT